LNTVTVKRNNLLHLWHGFRDFSPVGLIVFSYAIVFGALAVKNGLTILEASLMSLTVFAGASQFLALPMIHDGASVWTLTSMALMVNMRHLLYGLNIGKKYSGASPLKLLGLSFGIVDETYAFNTIGPGRKITSIPYFMGTALCGYVVWNTGTVLGAMAGRWTSILKAEGLDFAMLAVFISMIGSSIGNRRDWSILVCSGLAALAISRFAGGYWHLFVVGLAIPLAFAVLTKEGKNAA